jgi:hypothetical protein
LSATFGLGHSANTEGNRLLTNRKTVGVAATLLVALVGLAASPAFAEGSYGPSAFNNANEGFASNYWTDHQNDTTATKIQLNGCYKSNRVIVSSVELQLVDQWGLLPDALVGLPKSMSSCTYVSWAYSTSKYTMRDSSFYWQLNKVNGSGGNIYFNGFATATY